MYIVYDDANIFGLVRQGHTEDLTRIFNKYKINTSDYVELPYSLEYIGQNYIYVCKNGTVDDLKTRTDMWFDNIDDAEDYANRVTCEVWRYEFREISRSTGETDWLYDEHLIHEARRDRLELNESQEDDVSVFSDQTTSTETLVFTDLVD
jgi:hypothetical protein